MSPSDTALDRLTGRLRASGFTRIHLRLRGYAIQLEDGREPPPASSPAPARPQRPGATDVVAPGPGTVHLQVHAGAVVRDGAPLGYVQVHRRRMPLTAPAAGVFETSHSTDGDFVDHGALVAVVRQT